MCSRALEAPYEQSGPEEAVEGVKRTQVVPPSHIQRVFPPPQASGGTQATRPHTQETLWVHSPGVRVSFSFLSLCVLFFLIQGNSAVGGENEQAANERAAAAVCQACETPLGAQLDAVGGWTPFIFTLELFSSRPVCSVLFISESVPSPVRGTWMQDESTSLACQ